MNLRLKRRGIIKYLIAVPLLWLFVVIIFGMNESGSDGQSNSGRGDKQQYDQEMINKIIEKSKQNHLKHAHAHDHLFGDKHDDSDRHEEKHGRPIEEIKNTVKQEEIGNKIQVNAPKDQHNPNAPGELGKPVIIDKEKLSPAERKKFDDGWQNNAFNAYVSDMISLHRTLADIRDPACKTVKWYDPLPTTTVIVIFHNEAWSVLLRTIHSVLDRSDPKLLVEIIVVDDFSDFPHLGKPLQDYIDKLDKVKLVRTGKREGLIRARLKGAAVAKGEVLIFLDSHCEAAEGWLEPLIDPIARNPNTSTVPLIEFIDDNTFQLHIMPAEPVKVGGFDWNLIFNWHDVPKYEIERRKQKTDPIRSPTMAGGLFAINRKYFELLGSYDPGMDIWGGENLEISFKVWMCGGELVCTPCSHVGHLFRRRVPYKWPSSVNFIRKNTVRLAEVWLDEYKDYYYERLQYQLGDYGDVSERKALRQRLQCKSFDWYIKNVYPEKSLPGESSRYGEIRNSVDPYCVDSNKAIEKAVIGYPCHGEGSYQFWMLSKHGEIRRDDWCLDYSGGQSQLGVKDKIMIYPCHGEQGNQKWLMNEDHQIQHESGYCMELLEDKVTVVMQKCDRHNHRQIWQWKRRDEKDKKNIKIK